MYQLFLWLLFIKLYTYVKECVPNFNYRLEYLFLNCLFLSANFRRVRKTAKSDSYVFHVRLSFARLSFARLSFAHLSFVRLSAWTKPAPTERIFMKFYTWWFLEYVGKIQVSFKSDEHNECCTWRTVYIYDNIALNYLYNEKVSEKPVENIKTHIFCSLTFLKP